MQRNSYSEEVLDLAHPLIWCPVFNLLKTHKTLPRKPVTGLIFEFINLAALIKFL